MGAQVRRREGALGGHRGACWSYFACLGGSGRLKVSYSTRLEAQNVDKYLTFARFGDGRLRKAKSSYFTCLEGSGKPKVSCFTGLEAQNREKYETFARFWGGSVVPPPPFAAVWRPLFFRRGSRLFAQKEGFPSKILTFRAGAENRPH